MKNFFAHCLANRDRIIAKLPAQKIKLVMKNIFAAVIKNPAIGGYLRRIATPPRFFSKKKKPPVPFMISAVFCSSHLSSRRRGAKNPQCAQYRFAYFVALHFARFLCRQLARRASKAAAILYCAVPSFADGYQKQCVAGKTKASCQAALCLRFVVRRRKYSSQKNLCHNRRYAK